MTEISYSKSKIFQQTLLQDASSKPAANVLTRVLYDAFNEKWRLIAAHWIFDNRDHFRSNLLGSHNPRVLNYIMPQTLTECIVRRNDNVSGFMKYKFFYKCVSKCDYLRCRCAMAFSIGDHLNSYYHILSIQELHRIYAQSQDQSHHDVLTHGGLNNMADILHREFRNISSWKQIVVFFIWIVTKICSYVSD